MRLEEISESDERLQRPLDSADVRGVYNEAVTAHDEMVSANERYNQLQAKFRKLFADSTPDVQSQLEPELDELNSGFVTKAFGRLDNN